MRIFTLDPSHWWVAPLFSRNPLLRCSDRLESVVVVLALICALVAAPGAAASAAIVYRATNRVYVEQAHTRHILAATVTNATNERYARTVTARWQAAGSERTDSFQWDHAVKSGDQIDIWVNNAGSHVSPPTPTWHADMDAAGIGVGMGLTVALMVTALVVATRLRVDRVRDAQWERAIGHLVDNGGRSNWAQ